MSFIKELGKQKKNFLLFLLLLLTQSARLCKSSSPGCQGAGSHLGAVCLRTRPGLTGSRGANSNTGCRKSVISPDKKLKDLKTFLLLRMHKLNVLIILFNWKDTELFSSEKYNQTVWAKCFLRRKGCRKIKPVFLFVACSSHKWSGQSYQMASRLVPWNLFRRHKIWAKAKPSVLCLSPLEHTARPLYNWPPPMTSSTPAEHGLWECFSGHSNFRGTVNCLQIV